MGQRSLKKQMEGSDYEDKCGQWADDVGRRSNHEKRNDKSKRRKRGTRLVWLCTRVQRRSSVGMYVES